MRRIFTAFLLISVAYSTGCDCGAITAGPGGDAGTITVDEDGSSQQTDAAQTDSSQRDVFGNDTTVNDSSSADSYNADSYNADSYNADSYNADSYNADSYSADTYNADAASNNAPTVTITAPDDGAEFAQGESITMSCQATDAEDGTISNQNYTWQSDLEGQIGVGATIQNALSTVGTHTLTCSAVDSQGASGSDSVQLTIWDNFPPDCSIQDPEDNSWYHPDETIHFVGSAQDQEDGQLPAANLVWSSDIVGQIGTGTVQATLTEGDHVVTLTATDSEGGSCTAFVTVHSRANIPPQCQIDRPNDSDLFFTGDSIQFQGECVDVESGAVSNLTWTSNLEGQVGLGEDVQTALTTAGTHVISLCAPDPVDVNLLGCTQVEISIVENSAPTCHIDTPLDGAVVSTRSDIALTATVSDAEDPDLTGQQLSVQWSSDVAGDLSQETSTTIRFGNSQAGAHTLTLSVTDSVGLTCTDAISITVNRVPVANIDSVTQNGSPQEPFATNSAIDFVGSASDPDGDDISLVWIDTLSGEFGTTASAQLAAPLPGRHTVIFRATDIYGGSSQDSTSFSVLEQDQSSLFERYTALGMQHIRTMVPTAADQIYFGNDNRQLRSLDATDLSATSDLLLGNSSIPDDINDIYLDEQNGLLYLATKDGLVVCNYDNSSGIDNTSCQTYRNGDIPDDENDLSAVLRVTGSNSMDYLVISNEEGILVVDSVAGGNSGTAYLAETPVNVMVAGAGTVWIGTDNAGLFQLDPVTGSLNSWTLSAGLPSDEIQTLALSTDGTRLWIGTSNGLGQMVIASESFSVWRDNDPPEPGLVGDNIRCLAIHSATIAGTPRDVIWIGTSSGVSRFDRTIPAFTSFTVGEGVPANDVRSIVVLSDGTKVFATAMGLIRYTGL